jgi:hypothetical protein
MFVIGGELDEFKGDTEAVDSMPGDDVDEDANDAGLLEIPPTV